MTTAPSLDRAALDLPALAEQPLVLGLVLGLAAALALLLLVLAIVALRRALSRRPPPTPTPRRDPADDPRRALARAVRLLRRRVPPTHPWWIVLQPTAAEPRLAAAIAGVTAGGPHLIGPGLVLVDAPPDILSRDLGRAGTRPFDGILVAVDLADLAADRGALADRLRSELTDLERRLGLSLPLVLALVGLDHLPGADAALTDLARLPGQRRPWGIPLTPGLRRDQVRARFSAALTWLDDHLVARLQDDPDPERRAARLAFPGALAALADPLAALVERLTASPGPTPRPRALVLTGAPPAASRPSPLDMSFAPGISELLVQLAGDARLTPTRVRRRTLARAALATSAAALALLVHRGLAAAHDDARDLADATARALTRARLRSAPAPSRSLTSPPSPPEAPSLPVTSPRSRALSTSPRPAPSRSAPPTEPSADARLTPHTPRTTQSPSRAYADASPLALDLDAAAILDLLPLAERWRAPTSGLTLPALRARRERIAHALADLAADLVRDRLLRPHLTATIAALDDLLRRHPPGHLPNADDHRRARLLLDRYLRLTADDPADPCTTRPLLAGDLDPRARPHAALLAALPDPHTAPLALAPRDHRRIADARELLARVDPPRWVARQVESIARAGDLPDLTFRFVAGARVFEPEGSRLPAAFTRPGWQALHARITEHLADAACWRGPDRPEADLHAAYAAAYRSAWLDRLAELRIRRPQNLDDARALLGALTDARARPLSALRALILEHTQALPEADGALTRLQLTLAAGERPLAPPVDAPRIAADLRPIAAALDDEAYLGHLAALRRHIDAALQDPTQTQALRAAAELALADTRDRVAASDLDPHARELVLHLLTPPLDELLALLATSEGEQVQQAWCATIARPLRRLLLDHYPHDPNAPRDTPIRDLSRFLDPERGLVAAFAQDDLAPYLLLEGSQVLPRPRGRGDRRVLDPALVDFIAAALRAGEALHVDGHLRVDLDVTLACAPTVHEVALTVDGAALRYRCSVDPVAPLRWPGDDPRGAELSVAGRGALRQTIVRGGEWGLWRLVDAGRDRPAEDDGTLALRYPIGDDADIALVLRPAPSHVPLFAGDHPLAPLRTPTLLPPLRVFAGQPPCPEDP